MSDFKSLYAGSSGSPDILQADYFLTIMSWSQVHCLQKYVTRRFLDRVWLQGYASGLLSHNKK